MASLAAKYTKLKKQIGGNREKTHYEETFGMPFEEFYKITMPNKHIRRILSEVEFSIRLSKEKGGKFDHDISNALDVLLSRIEADGVLTKSACEEGEKLLLPLSAAAKEYNLILAAHAHIDMNWMWGWQETVASTIATFQTMLNLMDEYKDFHFSQSQTSVYKIIDDYAPELKPRIQQYIKEGRWEITSSAWVETDKNMPSTESILNHIYYTKKYLSENWGIDPNSLDLDFSPDTFGHSANIPELDSLGGIKYYYHCRGLDGDNALYRWRAPSGREVLVYREQYWYNSGMTPLPAIGLIDVSNRSGGLKTGLMVYGVGDHGGGPTRRDIERAIEMSQWPVFPNMTFGTFHDFFRAAENVRDKLPVIEQELNCFAPGCYTTQSRIKMGNRHTEAALFDAQAINALAARELKTEYPEKQYESAWQNVLFSHFHDILTGSCVQETREHAIGLFAHSMAVAGTRASLSMQAISAQIDFSSIQLNDLEGTQSEGAGAGYGLDGFCGIPAPERGRSSTRIFNLFNTSGIEREQCCEITVWDYTGDLRQIAFTDFQNNPVEFALIDSELLQYWDHKYFRVLVKAKVPAFGYTTVILREKEPDEYKIYLQPENRSSHPYEDFILENDNVKAVFSHKNGELISFYDKKTKKERLIFEKTGGLRVIATEKDSSNAWNIGRYVSLGGTLETISLKGISGAPLKKGFTMVQEYNGSKITSVISLKDGDAGFNVSIEADWHEIAQSGSTVPVLAYVLPVISDNCRYDIPGGSIVRKAGEIDVPGLQYGAAIDENRAMFIASDCKYGYRANEYGLVATLINSTSYPDPYPERAIHKISLCVGICDSSAKLLEETAFALSHPIRYQPCSVHNGNLPMSASLLSVDSSSAVISGVSSENGTLIIKLYETEGRNTDVTISVYSDIQTACTTALDGTVIEKLTPNKNKVSFCIKANSTVIIAVK